MAAWVAGSSMEHREAVDLPGDLPVHVQWMSLVRIVLWDRGGRSSGNSRGEGSNQILAGNTEPLITDVKVGGSWLQVLLLHPAEG